jgi:Spy/CpxP family protein refolding chaperone
MTLAALIYLPAMIWAQPPPEDDMPTMGLHRREHVERRVQTMKMWKLTEELNLSEDQATKFLPLMNAFDQKMDEVRRTRQESMHKLSYLAWDEKAKPAEINKVLEILENLEDQQMALRKQFHKDIAGILEPAQLGRMVLFNHRFPDMMRDAIRDYEDRRDMDRPPGPPPGRRGW